RLANVERDSGASPCPERCRQTGALDGARNRSMAVYPHSPDTGSFVDLRVARHNQRMLATPAIAVRPMRITQVNVGMCGYTLRTAWARTRAPSPIILATSTNRELSRAEPNRGTKSE